jgi:S-adenosylmethionine hydrolase
MNNDIVTATAKKLGVSSERVFGLAFEYAEKVRDKQYVLYQFLEWVYRGIIHQVVEDYCIDVMAERATIKVKKQEFLVRPEICLPKNTNL